MNLQRTKIKKFQLLTLILLIPLLIHPLFAAYEDKGYLTLENKSKIFSIYIKQVPIINLSSGGHASVTDPTEYSANKPLVPGSSANSDWDWDQVGWWDYIKPEDDPYSIQPKKFILGVIKEETFADDRKVKIATEKPVFMTQGIQHVDLQPDFPENIAVDIKLENIYQHYDVNGGYTIQGWANVTITVSDTSVRNLIF